MANNCGYDMMITGPDYETALAFAEKFETLGRIFDAYIEDDWDSCKSIMITGDCAWSLESSLNISRRSFSGKPLSSLFMDEAEKLGITLEAYGEELGCAFMEHYLIRDGELVCSEECRYERIDLDDESLSQEDLEEIACKWNFPTVEAMLDNEIDGFIPLGGYECDFNFMPATPLDGAPNERDVCKVA